MTAPLDPLLNRLRAQRHKNPLRQWLKDAQVSQAQLAKRIGYQPAMMSMVVNGRRKFSAEQVVKCAAVTGISEHDLHLIFLNHRPHYKRKPGRRRRPD